MSLQASKRLESGEISQEDFLNMAHQIKHLFQYQEEKQRSQAWDGAQDQCPPAQPRSHDAMDAAELSYYEHKSKLRKTQVSRRVPAEDTQNTSEDGGDKSLSAGHPYIRLPRDRPGETLVPQTSRLGVFLSLTCLMIDR